MSTSAAVNEPPQPDARGVVLPCHTADPDLFFSDLPAELEAAKDLCRRCPAQRTCLTTALARKEPLGVWGGQILQSGHVIDRKRGRGRPRKAVRSGNDQDRSVSRRMKERSR
jgi:WhiB family redox-sensing transcriptional regulator